MSGAASRTCSQLSDKQRRLTLAGGANACRQIDARHVRQAQRICDERRNERRVAHRRERHEDNAHSALIRDRACEFQREPGLADSSWPENVMRRAVGSVSHRRSV